MTTPNFTAQADVALDPMAGTLQTGRIAYSPDFESEESGTARVLQAHRPATPHETSSQLYGGRTAMQCAARGCDGCMVCTSRSSDFAQVDQKSAGDAGEAADTYARAGMFQDEPFPPLGKPERGTAIVPGVPADVPGVNVCILALDLGTKLGWAVRARDGRIVHGTEAFTPRKSWTPGQRWLRARSFLTDVIVRHQVHAIAYEDVKRHAGTDAAHAYGAFLCLVQMVADSHRTALLPVGVGTIKKHWTGKGNADKDAMKAQAKVRGFSVVDDNDADALAILHWAVAQERAA